jgi:hypothetical protein
MRQLGYWTGIGIVLTGLLLLWGPSSGEASATIHNFRDTLSNSAPGESANHTVEFQTKITLPPSSTIRFVPGDGQFEIPSAFDVDSVALYVSTGSGFTLRPVALTPSTTEDQVTIVPGTLGSVTITLNSVDGIPADATIRLLLGTHTPTATSTDVGIINPTATGTHPYTIELDAGTGPLSVTGRVAIVDVVQIADIDTREFDPPFRFGGAPSGTISGTTVAVQMSLRTDEFARCRYSTATNTPFLSMGNAFSANFTTVHFITISVATNTTYTFFVRCVDDEGNVNLDDYVINFTVPEFPTGVPGPGGENEGEGAGTGEGSGDASPGGGDPSGGDNTSGGSSTGGGGGGGGGGGSGPSSGGNSGGGGLEGTSRPFQSGDGRVIINGFAFPNSRVSILVDGTAVDQTTAQGNGAFSYTIDAIARGVYTFGVFATDANGTRSSTFSTTFSVTGARGSTLSNVNIMPSIRVTPDPVPVGETARISGFAIPNAAITIENQQERGAASLRTLTTNSAANGAWSIDLPTTGFNPGTYKVRARAQQAGGVVTNFSAYTFYGVGQSATVPRNTDLNRDGRVNLTDFSILIFWWNSAGGNSNPPADINSNGRVGLEDFSILLFNWTG